MRLLLDEHYSSLLAERLRAGGHDVRSVEELGIRGFQDEPLLEHATGERRALLTNNVKHFSPLAIRWAAAGREHYGLLFTDDDSMPRGLGSLGLYIEVLAALLSANSAEDALRDRVRWLP